MRLTTRATLLPSLATEAAVADRLVIRDTIFAATIAGILAALVLTVMQSGWITPLILQAEVYEDSAGKDEMPAIGSHSATEHHHDDSGEWKPENGWQRTAFTFAANLLLGVGYGFVLTALYLLWREPRNTLTGAAYGVGGFCVFFLAPALGLPPELPGTPAAELVARQEWWIMTAAATAIGLIILFSKVPVWARALAVAIVAAPHFVPAPHLTVETPLAPIDLQSRFRLLTTIGNGVFWLCLGLVSAIAWRRLGLARSGSEPPSS